MKKLCKEKFKNSNAITLVTLVITIIVLLILSGVIINSFIGENNLITRAKLAVNETKMQQAKEKMNLKITNAHIQSYAETNGLSSLQYLADQLCEDDDIEYVRLKQEVASLQKITVGESKSILTKLKEYSFEFEINDQLQLASIDGIQVASDTGNSNVNSPVNAFDINVSGVTSNSMNISYSTTSTAANILRYVIIFNNQYVTTTEATTYAFTRLNPQTSYTIRVVAIDAEGNTRTSSVVQATSEIIAAPDELENVGFSYNTAANVSSVAITMNYPAYAETKKYKIGTNGTWEDYNEPVIIVQNDTVYAKYTTLDERESEVSNVVVQNIVANLSLYTNYSEAITTSRTTVVSEKITAIKNLFNTTYSSSLNICLAQTVSEEMYFQYNGLKPIEASQVRVKCRAGSGYEAVKSFRITASTTPDFAEEVTLYTGTRETTGSDSYGPAETTHQFTSQGEYQFYRIYVTEWYAGNGSDGANIIGVYFE